MENRIEFTEEMRKTHTILIPNMLPVHFELIANVLVQHGYKIELLKNEGRAVVDAGLSYVPVSYTHLTLPTSDLV